jgi:hypothetical protein
MMDFRRRRGEGTLDKIGNFLKSNFFLMLKLSKNSPNFQNHKTEINKKKLLVKLEKTATVITERESLWTGSMTGTGERERERTGGSFRSKRRTDQRCCFEHFRVWMFVALELGLDLFFSSIPTRGFGELLFLVANLECGFSPWQLRKM